MVSLVVYGIVSLGAVGVMWVVCVFVYGFWSRGMDWSMELVFGYVSSVGDLLGRFLFGFWVEVLGRVFGFWVYIMGVLVFLI